MLTFPIYTNDKSSKTKWMKKEARSIWVDPEYVTGQINSHIQELLFKMILFDFCTISKILICFSLIKRFSNNHERYFSHLYM